MAFSKVRREVQYFAEELTQFHRQNESLAAANLHSIDVDVLRVDREVVSHHVLMKALVGSPEDARAFCGPFYRDVRLVQWFVRLRREFVGSAGKSALNTTIPALIGASRGRTRWQVLRLYRRLATISPTVQVGRFGFPTYHVMLITI